MVIGANRDRNDDRQLPRDEFSQGQPVNRPIPAHHRRQLVYCDDSEEDLLFGNHPPVIGNGRYVHNHERDGGDF